ncbi:DsrH/TusB family sulfur relay protein [Marinobacter gelidimuriae]|uniref:DsrH/TusB family sulfur relay protein n=1 Tax=Marinobacter gelidimuriae TaxID=2739064 RepID=UPI0003AA9C5B|nr:DsrH/TusB family sulfur metabolism protein [Marinobacter gelidimuriae]
MNQSVADLPAHIHTLHILNKTVEHPRAAQCLATLATADTVLLIENAVLSAPEVAAAAPCPVFMLAADARARGLIAKSGAGTEATGATPQIGYEHMVQLSALATRIISW